MTQVTPERKERVIKSLALFGLFAVIIFIAWLSVQIVSTLPSAVTSLASLAESVYQYDPQQAREIKIIDAPDHLTTGLPTTIRWDKPFKNGSYSFSYACGKDIFLEVTSTESDFAGLECNKNYNLGNVDSASLLVHKDTTDQLKLEYTISYFKTNAVIASASSSHATGIIQGSDVPVGPSTSVEVTVNEQPLTPKPTTSTVATNSPKPPQPEPTFIYQIPVSKPNGTVDLAVSYAGIGMINSAGNFVSTGSLKKDSAGAIQFIVHNIGTKTSDTWSFTTLLPGDVTFTSKTQEPLKPNEKTTLTISFPAVNEATLQKFNFAATVKNDINEANNKVNWSTVVLY